MDCNRIQDRLVDYVTEETRITERLCVEVHLATCYHCRAALDDVRTVLEAAKDASRYAGPEASFESLMGEIRTRDAIAAGAGQSSNRWSWGVAAAALPIVVACITPFIVAWPGAQNAGSTSDTAESISDTALKPDTVRRELSDPIRPVFTEHLLAPN